MKDKIKYMLADLRHLTISPRRYTSSPVTGEDGWSKVIRGYGNTEKRIQSSNHRWYVIEFDDGHEELAFLRVLRGGLFSGKCPAIYRGFLPGRIDFVTFSHVKDIRPAF